MAKIIASYTMSTVQEARLSFLDMMSATWRLETYREVKEAFESALVAALSAKYVFHFLDPIQLENGAIGLRVSFHVVGYSHYHQEISRVGLGLKVGDTYIVNEDLLAVRIVVDRRWFADDSPILVPQAEELDAPEELEVPENPLIPDDHMFDVPLSVVINHAWREVHVSTVERAIMDALVPNVTVEFNSPIHAASRRYISVTIRETSG